MTKPPNNEQPERVDKRIQVALPVRVTYWDREYKPCLDMACTYDISPRGARISGLRSPQVAGEIIAIERGKNKIFFRVIWVGEANTELSGQVGIQSVETERIVWEAELRDMDDVYDPVSLGRSGPVPDHSGSGGNRRRQPRVPVEGVAQLENQSATINKIEGVVRDLSETGCLIVTHNTLPVGAELALELDVANYKLRFKGRVRHSDRELGTGIEFRGIRKGDRQILKFLLRKMSEQELEAAFQFDLPAVCQE
ncbi:MAG: PilZ domain-containing protein [Acidobacteriales bacterium]|nr:PilZ domain-containing protein [Terriglobales bacterium]